jgi:hypothetical protein
VVAKEKHQALPEVVPAFRPLQPCHLDSANCSSWLQLLICGWKGPPNSSGISAFSGNKQELHINTQTVYNKQLIFMICKFTK